MGLCSPWISYHNKPTVQGWVVEQCTNYCVMKWTMNPWFGFKVQSCTHRHLMPFPDIIIIVKILHSRMPCGNVACQCGQGNMMCQSCLRGHPLDNRNGWLLTAIADPKHLMAQQQCLNWLKYDNKWWTWRLWEYCTQTKHLCCYGTSVYMGTTITTNGNP